MSGNIVEANPVLNGRRQRIQSPKISDNVDEDNNITELGKVEAHRLCNIKSKWEVILNIFYLLRL